jgi:hypothetical protein
MEEAAVSVVRLLAVLDLPVALFGIVIGVFTALWRPFYRPVSSVARLPERIAVGLCLAVAVLGAIGILLTILKRQPPPTLLATVFAVLILVIALPAVLWNSRWRRGAEGVATVALSVDAILAGFSIGPLFVPLVILMLWVCAERIRETWNAPIPAPPTRVDSLP